MVHSELCPVCNGKGKLEDMKVTQGSKNCHGCGGLGWVVVQDQSRIAYQPFLVDDSKKMRL